MTYYTPPTRCPVCDRAPLTHIGPAPLYIENGTIDDVILKCRACGTYLRAVDYDDPVARSHFNVASYTQPHAEERFRRARIGFLTYLTDVTQAHLRRPLSGARVLDIGPAYGHGVGLLRDRGAICSAVEVVAALRDRLLERGINAYANIDDIPAGETFDAVTMLDSFYYVQDPFGLLRKIHQRLGDPGLLVIRVANRTPYFNLLRASGQTISTDRFGDVKYNFSARGITQLLERSGFVIERYYLREPGKKHISMAIAAYYQLTLVASALTGMKLTPGLTIVARPKR